MVDLDKLSDLGAVRPHTRLVAEEFVARFPILQTWGMGNGGEHVEGRALDLMVFTNTSLATSAALGDRIWTDVWANAKRLGVEYAIWTRQIRSTVVSPGQVRPYTGSNPHTDHVHITFLEEPPAYMPPADLPLPLRQIHLTPFNEAYTLDTTAGVKEPSHPGTVKYGQTALNKALPAKLDTDGWYGNGTRTAVKAWQTKQGDTATGVVNREQWYALAKASGVFTYPDPSPPPLPVVSLAAVTPHRTPIGHLQRALNKAAGADLHGAWYGATTAAAVKVWQKKQGHTQTGVLTLAEWQALAEAAGTFTAKE